MKSGSKNSKSKLPGRFSFDELRHKRVIIISGSIVYKGIFLGADDSDIYLKGDLRYLVLPMERITSMRLESAKPVLNALKSVDADFYKDSD